MQLEPAALDRIAQPGSELGAAGLQREQEWRVDPLDIDAAVPHSRDAGRKLHELARSGLRIGVRTFAASWICPSRNTAEL